eukprot:COSAG06_NODE_33558_length_487_cov_1171.360825_1_plen_43_part_10
MRTQSALTPRRLAIYIYIIYNIYYMLTILSRQHDTVWSGLIWR